MVKNIWLEIKNGADLAERIRDYSRSQVELWQQVPFLAYLNPADALSKFFRKGEDTFSKSLVSIKGYLPVGELTRQVHYDGYGNKDLGTFVDLETGEIIEWGLEVSKEPAKTDFILSLAANIQELNAAKLVTKLKSTANERSQDYIQARKEEWLNLYNHRPGSNIYTKKFLDTITF